MLRSLAPRDSAMDKELVPYILHHESGHVMSHDL